MTVDITGLSLVVAEMLGVSQFAGGVFCTFVLFIAIMFPAAILLRSPPRIIYLVLAFFVLGLATSFGWIDFWWILILGALVAFGGAKKFGLWFG